MELKINDAIRSLGYHDLLKLHEDLKSGGAATAAIVLEQIRAREKELGKQCHVCQSELDPASTSNYTILLGPEGLRRKASFCAIDCLKYFLSNLESQQEMLKRKMLKAAEDKDAEDGG